LEDVAGNVRDQRNGSARDVDTVDLAFVEMPRDDRVTCAEIRILSDPAWAKYTAVAHFQQASFEVIGHDVLPRVERGVASDH
jgi:hypothetical protein